MSILDARSILLASLVAAGCGSGGLDFWLYPEPRLLPQEEAVLITYESNLVLLLDGEDVATMCWGDRRMAAQAYRRTDRPCRLHMGPGLHSLVFQTGLGNQQRATLEFTALPGTAYGIRRSGCTSSTEGIQQNCRIEVVAVGTMSEGG
jgi:hypothetical protein